MALAEAGLEPSAIDYINAHGTATSAGDIAETKAIKVALGKHARSVAISSNKSMIGHCLGASGAIEAVATVLTIVNGLLPPTINLTRPGPGLRPGLRASRGALPQGRRGRQQQLRLRRPQRHAGLPPFRRLTTGRTSLMNVTVEIERRDSDPVKPEWACPSCTQPARLAEVRANLMVCPHCGFHLRVSARERIRQLVDEGTFRELWSKVLTLDPLKFTDLETYPERVREAQAKTGLNEAIVTGTAAIDGTQCVLAVMDFGFMGGSMGSVVGEKLWRSAELAAGEDLPLVAVCSSGGARMQEGILSLMQMAKTSCAVDLINEATSPFVAAVSY